MKGLTGERVKGFSITLLIATFFVFVFYQTQKSADFHVLRINSPTEIVIDLNKNNVEDDNELVTLSDIKSFSTKKAQSKFPIAKMTQEDAIGLGFFAENFAKETLENREVKYDKKTNQIIIDNKNYENLLINKGLALKNNGEGTSEVRKNLEKIRKLHLIIFNNKSHKYHKLTCKYGVLAHNSQILPVSQVPKDAKACKFCLVPHKNKLKTNKYSQKYNYDDKIPNIKSPPTVLQMMMSSGAVKIFLTDFTKVLKPSNNCNTTVCKTLVKEIDSAQSSIDFAIYGYTKIPKLQKSLENAQLRGIKIRYIYDLDKNGGNIYPDTLYLAKILKNNRHDNQSPIMHDKFFIIDNHTVITGSANISNTDMSGFNSNAIMLINSEKIADIYTQEFEQMYGGKFHKTKSKIDNKQADDLSVYFSPEDKPITTQVIPLIDSAHKYIYMPVFLITHKALANSLIRASKRGVAVKIILDATNTHTGSSKMKMLRQSGIQVKTENFAGKLHSKSIIIDDLYTVIGSMNFSRSGEGLNDENLIIIKNREIALFYKTFFQYLWQRIPEKWLKLNARSESPDSIGSCSDGIDNDFDGKIDKADESCKPFANTKHN